MLASLMTPLYDDHPDPVARDVLGRCAALGFALAGVCDADPIERAPALREWLDAGKHGQMGWMVEHAEKRTDPGAVLPGARGVVMVADLVRTRNDAPTPPAAGRGRIARYAQGRDYHSVIKKRLHTLCDALREAYPGSEHRAFVDTAPVMERDLAARAGLGWIGKHTLLINPALGSHMLLGGVLTTLAFDRPAPEPDHCGACTRCIDACPTDAITPFSVDARRCISYLTIEHKGPIDDGLAHQTGDWVVGCDICQDVCPHNSARPAGVGVGGAHEAYAPRRDSFDLVEMVRWSEEDRREATRTSAMKRLKLDQFRRNAENALRNDPTF